MAGQAGLHRLIGKPDLADLQQTRSEPNPRIRNVVAVGDLGEDTGRSGVVTVL
jgi:hypothetical protein